MKSTPKPLVSFAPSGRKNAGSVAPLVGPDMATRPLLVASKDAVIVKGIVEAHDGLAAVFAEHGGELILASPKDREDELDALAKDLAAEFSPFFTG